MSSRTLQANIHQADEKAPVFYHHSKFFKHAPNIEKIESQLPQFVSATRQAFAFRNLGEVAAFRGPTTQGHILEITLNLPRFPSTVRTPQVLVFDTPENNAMTVGRLTLSEKSKEKSKLVFQLPRFHTGIPAIEDLTQAMFQAAQAPQIKNLITKLDDPVRQMFIVYLTREGHLTEWHRALYHHYGLSVPFTISHTEHAPHPEGNTQFARVTKVCPINTEGMTPNETEILVVGDNTASGMQQVAVIEETIATIRRKNNGKHNLKHLLVVSPLLTLYGASVIAEWAAAEEKLATTFVVSGALLGCNLPDRYFSPVLADQNLTANPHLIQLNHTAYGPKAAGRACVRGNWTASFMAPGYALARSEEELRMYGTSNEEVLETSQNLKLDNLKKWAIEPEEILPYSTWLTANHSQQLAILKKLR